LERMDTSLAFCGLTPAEVEPEVEIDRRADRHTAPKGLGVGGTGGPQEFRRPLPLGRAQAVVDVVRGQQAEGALAVRGSSKGTMPHGRSRRPRGRRNVPGNPGCPGAGQRAGRSSRCRGIDEAAFMQHRQDRLQIRRLQGLSGRPVRSWDDRPRRRGGLSSVERRAHQPKGLAQWGDADLHRWPTEQRRQVPKKPIQGMSGRPSR
jgi:hypothetical protein